jgi:hypothetical protein
VLRGPKTRSEKSREEDTSVGELVVEQIHPDTVILRHEGQSCWLGMFNERSHEKVERERAASKRAKAKAKRADRAKRKRKASRKGR